MLGFNLFDRDFINRSPVTGIVNSTDINYLRRIYTYNKDAIENYYQTRNFAVKNTHILSRILEHFPVYLGYDAYRYLEYANDKTKYLAKHFKFTSEIEKGIVHPSYFFGNEGEEIILANYEPFDVHQCVLNWKTEKAVTVIKHARNDTKLLLPLGNNDGSRSGLDIVSINIPKLSLKYREFIRQQTVQESDETLRLSKNHFVMKYVLSTMMEETIDHILLNKIMDRFYGREEVIPKFKHRFKIFEPSTQLNRYLDQTVDIITNKRLDFVNILHNIPLIFNLDASELLAYNETGSTRQIKWALIISRLDYMLFLYDVSKNKDLDKHILNDWKRLAKQLIRDQSVSEMFSYSLGTEIKEKLDRLTQL